MKKQLTTSIITLSAMVVTNASTVVYVDFGDNAQAAISSSDTYNTLTPSATGVTTSLEGSGESFSNLVDTTGASTGVDLNVLVTSTGGDVRGGETTTTHDSITGIDDNALNDGFWVNNGSITGEVSFVLTFSSLTASAYDIQLTSGSGLQRDTTWQISTGTGDASTTTITTANKLSSLATWSGVAPDSGEIVITGTYTADSAFNTGTVNFISLVAVPEPSSTALAALGGLALTFRRRK